MVDFISQLDWIVGARYLAIHYFWARLWGCFQMRLAFGLVNWEKQVGLPKVNGPHPILWEPQYNKKTKKEFALCLSTWTGTGFFPHLDQNLQHHLSLFSGLWTGTGVYTIVSPDSQGLWGWTEATPLAFLGLQLADGRLWDFSSSIIMQASSL